MGLSYGRRHHRVSHCHSCPPPRYFTVFERKPISFLVCKIVQRMSIYRCATISTDVDTPQVKCSMPSPLVWNASRTWSFDVAFDKPEIYILRDHITLITDLSKDWTSGPVTEHARFIPVIYDIHFSLNDFKLVMYLNDHNVIDYPLSDLQNCKRYSMCELIETSALTLECVLSSTSPIWSRTQRRSSSAVPQISTNVQCHPVFSNWKSHQR